MKKTLILTLIILLFPIIAFAQNGLVNPNQVAPVTISVEAGEDLSAGDVVSLINSGGTMKAYNNLTTVSTSPNGAESVFNAATSNYINAVALDSTRFLVSYALTRNKSKVGTVSGTSISWGSESDVWEDVAASYNAICKIGTDKVLAVYRTTTQVRAVVLSISSTSITVNAATALTIIDGEVLDSQPSLTQLDTDKALLCFTTGAVTQGRCVVISVSETTPSAGTIATFNAAATSYISVSALSSTSAIVAYRDEGNSNFGTAQILSISGTTITPGTEYVFESGGTTQYCVATALDTNKALITYSYSTGIALVATNTSGVLSFGGKSSFTGAAFHGASKISENKVIIASRDSSANGFSFVASISGSNVACGTEYLYNPATTSFETVCYLGNNKSAIAYQDFGNSSYGTAVVNQWATASYASVAGISQGAYSSGSDAVVLISGVSDDQSGLIVGSPYFLQSDFTIGTTPVSLAKYYNSSTATGEIKIGTAKSATELILGIDYK